MIRGGVFGPSLCGKTTLVKSLSRDYFNVFGIRSLVLDTVAQSRDWGSQAWVCFDAEKFWPQVWQCRACLVIVDDGSVTIKRDKDLIGVFTAMRHCHHRLLVVGHDSSDLLPVMRRQFDTLYLFKQDRNAADAWANVFMNDDILNVTQLNQYEFLRCQAWKPVEKLKLTL
jgi:hypothetical protein